MEVLEEAHQHSVLENDLSFTLDRNCMLVLSVVKEYHNGSAGTCPVLQRDEHLSRIRKALECVRVYHKYIYDEDPHHQMRQLEAARDFLVRFYHDYEFKMRPAVHYMLK